MTGEDALSANAIRGLLGPESSAALGDLTVLDEVDSTNAFLTRLPDPVLQQLEHFGNPALGLNDAFKAVTRYWDRITHPAQVIQSLPAAIATMLDPADCGPAFIALPQIPPRNTNWSGSGKWVHWAKIGFEKYYLRKIKQGRVEPFWEKYAMRLMGVQKLRGSS